MYQERLDVFNSFGESSVLCDDVHSVKILPDVELIFHIPRSANRSGDHFTLYRSASRSAIAPAKTTKFTGVNVSLREDGSMTLSHKGLYLVITGCSDGYYFVTSTKRVIDLFKNNYLITFSDDLTLKKIDFESVTEKSNNYKVIFDNSLNLSFSDVPENILKFFEI